MLQILCVWKNLWYVQCKAIPNASVQIISILQITYVLN